MPFRAIRNEYAASSAALKAEEEDDEDRAGTLEISSSAYEKSNEFECGSLGGF